MAQLIDPAIRKQEVRRCLSAAQVPPRRFFALYLGLVTVIDIAAVAVQLMGGDTPLMEDLPALFAVVLSNLLVQILLAGSLLWGLRVWRGQRVEYAGLFDGFGFAGRCIVVTILQVTIIGAGATLMLLPGLYFFYVYRFALLELCQAPEISPIEAMRRSRFHTTDYKRPLFLLDLRYLGWIVLARLPALYQNLVYLLQAYSQLYGWELSFALPALPLSALAETILCDLFYLVVALFYLPAYTVAQASYFDTAWETRPIPWSPRLPDRED